MLRTTRLARVLAELGIPKLWREDPERAWFFTRLAVRPVIRAICPSYAYGVDRVPVSG